MNNMERLEALLVEKAALQKKHTDRIIADWMGMAKRLSVESHHYHDLLLNLLAVIHRDGGQYTQEHGLEKSVAEAMKLSAERRKD